MSELTELRRKMFAIRDELWESQKSAHSHEWACKFFREFQTDDNVIAVARAIAGGNPSSDEQVSRGVPSRRVALLRLAHEMAKQQVMESLNSHSPGGMNR